MIKFKTGTNIGKIIAERVKGFPVFNKPPKKRPKKKRLTCWILCPDFRVKLPKLIDTTPGGDSYSFSIRIYGDTRKEVLKALNHMIGCGLDDIEADNRRFWLYAVKHSIQHKGLFIAELKYIFRVKKLPEEIS